MHLDKCLNRKPSITLYSLQKAPGFNYGPLIAVAPLDTVALDEFKEYLKKPSKQANGSDGKDAEQRDSDAEVSDYLTSLFWKVLG